MLTGTSRDTENRSAMSLYQTDCLHEPGGIAGCVPEREHLSDFQTLIKVMV